MSEIIRAGKAPAELMTKRLKKLCSHCKKRYCADDVDICSRCKDVNQTILERRSPFKYRNMPTGHRFNK